MIATFNSFHLGDNLLHLHFLRKCAAAYPSQQFHHYCPPTHFSQLHALTADLDNLTLFNLPTGVPAINAWRGAGGWWYTQPNRNDFVGVHLAWFRHLAAAMGIESPLKEPRDLLFDYPALRLPKLDGGIAPILVINSPPHSGQFQEFSLDGFDHLIRLLLDAGHQVVSTAPSLHAGVECTQDRHWTVTDIGRFSQRCRAVIGVATGPLWPTFNIWMPADAPRLLFLDAEYINLAPRMIHLNRFAQAPEYLRAFGLI